MNLRWLVHPQLRQVGDHKAIPLVPGTDHAKSMKVRLQYRAAVRFSRSRTRWCGFIDIHREAGSTKTRFATTAILAQLKPDLVWLRGQVLSAIGRGEERGAIHQANLIPPGLIAGQPDVYLPYFIMREHIIDRLYDQNVGYWQADMQGIDHLTSADRASL
jgi:hypothetical protein